MEGDLNKIRVENETNNQLAKQIRENAQLNSSIYYDQEVVKLYIKENFGIEPRSSQLSALEIFVKTKN